MSHNLDYLLIALSFFWRITYDLLKTIKYKLMKVNIQSVNFNIDKGLVDFTQNKADGLEKYYDKIIGIDVYLKLQNTSEKENKIAELKLLIPGDEFIVKKQCKSFEEAVDTAIESLKRQLRKKKEKQRAHQV